MGEAPTGRSVQRGGVSSPGLMIDLPVCRLLVDAFPDLDGVAEVLADM
jgi:hypothetical protein